MNTTGTMLSLFGASCLFAFSTAAPAFADTKPCCHTSSGSYQNVTPSTCTKYGGRVVSQRYCQRGGYGPSRQTSTSFSITLGDVVIAYSDGYYDNNRRWHPWRNNDERNWYQKNRRASYHGVRHDRDRDRKRRDWRDGKRNDWR
jgi:hypothetical protein